MNQSIFRMAAILAGLLTVLASTDHAVCVASEKSPTSPTTFAKAVVDEPIYQFEPVLDGQTITHTFTIKNTGTAELKIIKVRTG